jgi:hypothetical protein
MHLWCCSWFHHWFIDLDAVKCHLGAMEISRPTIVGSGIFGKIYFFAFIMASTDISQHATSNDFLVDIQRMSTLCLVDICFSESSP